MPEIGAVAMRVRKPRKNAKTLFLRFLHLYLRSGGSSARRKSRVTGRVPVFTNSDRKKCTFFKFVHFEIHDNVLGNVLDDHEITTKSADTAGGSTFTFATFSKLFVQLCGLCANP